MEGVGLRRGGFFKSILRQGRPAGNGAGQMQGLALAA